MADLRRAMTGMGYWAATGQTAWDETQQIRHAPPSRYSGEHAIGRHLVAIDRAVETEIVPQLVMARGTSPDPSPAIVVPTAGEIEAFAALVLGRDDAPTFAFLKDVRDRGMSVESVYLDLLTPAARHLGELWSDDLLDFSSVTLGLFRLHQVMRDLSRAFQDEASLRPSGLPILLMPMSGEQHTFGLVMVSEFFRRAGWRVWGDPPRNRSELLDAVKHESFAVVGFSVSCDTDLERLAATIHTVRLESKNRGVGIMVGGRVFLEHPGLVARIGADATQ